jgi:hypothetical protein
MVSPPKCRHSAAKGKLVRAVLTLHPLPERSPSQPGTPAVAIAKTVGLIDVEPHAPVCQRLFGALSVHRIGDSCRSLYHRPRQP